MGCLIVRPSLNPLRTSQVKIFDGRSLLDLRVKEEMHWTCGTDPACGGDPEAAFAGDVPSVEEAALQAGLSEE